jgi:transcription antitermination factor NusG
MNNIEQIYCRYPEDRTLSEDKGLWWALHVKPNREWRMASFLTHKRISYYLPVYEHKKRYGHPPKEKTVLKPLFRGYICFALDKDNHSALYGSHDFVRIIEVPDQDQFVRELESIAIALKVGKDLFVRSGLASGKKVRVVSGPFKGVEGVVSRHTKKGQIAISVEMFNRTVIINLDEFTTLDVLD